MRFAAPPSTFKTISYRRRSEETTFLVKRISHLAHKYLEALFPSCASRFTRYARRVRQQLLGLRSQRQVIPTEVRMCQADQPGS